MKTAAMILIMIFSTGVGVYLSFKLVKRSTEWEKICYDFRELMYCISQSKKPVCEAIEKIAPKSRVFTELSGEKRQDVAEAYRKMRAKGTATVYLTRDDCDFLESFFSEAGRYNFDAQKALSEDFTKKVQTREAELNERVSKYVKLYSVGCLTAGLFAVIALW